ncbi:MAG: DUF1592 domain-containing protein [Phycisphaerales bacterium]
MVFGEDLFRRGVSKDEAMELVATATRAAGPKPTWDGLLRALATALMVDPRFLLRIEPACAEGTCDLPPGTIAERMAFFLWSSVPDAALRAAARAGALADDAGRRAQVARMLADPRAASLAERFAVQWLGIDRLESKSLDAQTYPGVDAALVADMRHETERLFDDVVRGRRPLRALPREARRLARSTTGRTPCARRSSPAAGRTSPRRTPARSEAGTADRPSSPWQAPGAARPTLDSDPQHASRWPPVPSPRPSIPHAGTGPRRTPSPRATAARPPRPCRRSPWRGARTRDPRPRRSVRSP